MRKIRLIFSVALFFALCVPCFANEMFKTGVVASFYADKFHGRKTASGEKFNMYDYTAAHKTLPFGTILKVTNLSNGKSVNVRVNDRGPFAKGREIDLSKAAAIELDMITAGEATVSLEIVSDSKTEVASSTKTMTIEKKGKNQTSTTTTTKTTTKTASSNKAAEVAEKARKKEEQVASLKWDIQIGAYGKKDNAENMAKRLTDAGFENVVFQKGPSVIRVVIHDIPTDNVQQTLIDLEKQGFTDYFVRDRAD